MTFKHTNFQDSVTMRSLEKLARDKGWVKEQPMTKSAASQLDLNPSTSLTENVLKLCAGLRSAGMDKYAAELEEKFLNYKQAQTLYEVSKETGDDLVHAAHPKGSHKLEGVDSDEAVFEDILDKHMKHVKMVEKQPTGKLASSFDILRAVKVVLAQDTNAIINTKINDAYQSANSILRIMTENTSEAEKGATAMGRTMAIAPLVGALNPKNAPFDSAKIQNAQTRLNNSKANLQYVDPSEKGQHPASVSSYTAWTKIVPEFDKISGILNEVSNLLKGDVELTTKIDKMLTTLKSYRALLLDEGFTPQDRVDGNKEIDGYVTTLQNWQNIFSQLDPAQKAVQAPRYMEKLNKLNEGIANLYKEITGDATAQPPA